jgi:hypothetical protein
VVLLPIRAVVADIFYYTFPILLPKIGHSLHLLDLFLIECSVASVAPVSLTNNVIDPNR